MPASPTLQTRPTHLRSHTFNGLAPGPRLLVLGAVHGNEVCGSHGITQILAEIDSGTLTIERGSVTFVPITNPLACQLKQRVGDRNLNRNMAPSAIPQDFEDRLANVLCPLLEAHDVLLDLHSFHTGGAPFVMIGPQDNQGTLEPFAHASEEMQLALHTGPYRIVEGWLDTYARGVKRRADAAAAGGAHEPNRWSPTRITASAPPNTCDPAADTPSRSNAASTTTRQALLLPNTRLSKRWPCSASRQPSLRQSRFNRRFCD